MKLDEQYRLAIELLENESDRFWARNNIFLLIQAAFISLYASIIKDTEFYSVLLALQGFIIAFIWLGVLRKGATYVSRWDKVVRNIEMKMLSDKRRISFLGLKKLNDSVKNKENSPIWPISIVNKRTTLLITYFIYSLLLFWIVIILVSTARILFEVFNSGVVCYFLCK